jgi:hypothetical protein
MCGSSATRTGWPCPGAKEQNHVPQIPPGFGGITEIMKEIIGRSPGL